MLERVTRTIITGLPLIFLAATASAQNWEVGYDASLNTLPSAQGGEYFWSDPPPADGLTEGDYLVALGTLFQAPTGGLNSDPANREGYRFELPEADFDDGVFVVDFRLRIISSTYFNNGIPSAGFEVSLYDKDYEAATLYISSTRAELLAAYAPDSVVESFDTTADFVDYRIRVDKNGAALIINGTEIGTLERFEIPRRFGSENALLFGDRSRTTTSSSELQSIRVSHFAASVADVRNYHTDSDTFQTFSVSSTGLTVDCPPNTQALGGGATIHDGGGLVGVTDSYATGGTPATGWHAEGSEIVATDAAWQIEVHAICGEISDDEDLDWRRRNQASDYNGFDEKNTFILCPTGMVAIAGGASILESGSQGDAAVITSEPLFILEGEYPIGWYAEGRSTADLWYIDAQVECAPLADPTVSKAGMVGRWQGVHAGGDSWGEGHATLENGVGSAQGLTGTAFVFDGLSDQSVSIPSIITSAGENPTFDLYPEDDFTVDAWIQASTLQPLGFNSIVSLFDRGGVNTGGETLSYWNLGLDADGHVIGYVRDHNGPYPNSNSLPVGPSASALNDGLPHHVLLQRDNHQRVIRLYVDGVLEDTTQYQGEISDGPLFPGASPRPVRIGSQLATNSDSVINQFNGLVDDVKYWDRAIGQDEIRNIAGCGLPLLPRVLNLGASEFGSPSDEDHKLCVFLEAGDYQLTIVDPAADNDARFKAWSPGPGMPWGTAYSVEPASQPGFTSGVAVEASSAQEAYDATIHKTVAFSLSSDQAVDFSLIDQRVLDNRGGVSLRLEEYVPEPATSAMLAAGIGFLGLASRRRARARAGCVS